MNFRYLQKSFYESSLGNRLNDSWGVQGASLKWNSVLSGECAMIHKI